MKRTCSQTTRSVVAPWRTQRMMSFEIKSGVMDVGDARARYRNKVTMSTE